MLLLRLERTVVAGCPSATPRRVQMMESHVDDCSLGDCASPGVSARLVAQSCVAMGPASRWV